MRRVEASPVAAATVTGGRAKSMILVFLTGGPSHLDTFDLKPNAPADVRGEFQPVATSVPGIRSPSIYLGWQSGWSGWRSSAR